MNSISFLLYNPTILISIAALVISTWGLVYTILKDKEHTRRWDSLNLARLVIRNLQFTAWKTVKRKEFIGIDWGYSDPLGFAKSDESGTLDTEIWRIPIQIVAVHPEEGVLDGFNALTFTELHGSLIESGRDPRYYTFEKLFRIVFAIENVGDTRASDASVNAEVRDDEPMLSISPQGVPHPLEPGEKSWSMINMRMPLDKMLVMELHVSITLSFTDIHGDPHTQNLSYVFDKKVGTFRRA